MTARVLRLIFALLWARIASVKGYVIDTLSADGAARPPLEEVSFVFNRISWSFENGGVTFEDSLSGR